MNNRRNQSMSPTNLELSGREKGWVVTEASRRSERDWCRPLPWSELRETKREGIRVGERERAAPVRAPGERKVVFPFSTPKFELFTSLPLN
ncbi:unnamed protein product [Prunus armeniaca]